MKKIIFTILLMFLCSSVFATNYCNDANNVGCFLMEDSGTETDRGGNTSNDLTVTSSPNSIPQSATKKFGDYSRDFEYSDTEWLAHADNLDTDLSGVDQKISMVIWTKPEAMIGDHTYQNKWNWSTPSKQYRFTADDGENEAFQCRLSADGSTNSATATGATNSEDDGFWHHATCVYNDVDIRIYFDGSLDSNGADNPSTYTGGISTGSEVFAIGAQNTTYSVGGMMDGLLDDAGIFSDDLTSVEVSDIVTNGLTGSAAAARRIMMIAKFNAEHKEKLKQQGYGFKYYWKI